MFFSVPGSGPKMFQIQKVARSNIYWYRCFVPFRLPDQKCFKYLSGPLEYILVEVFCSVLGSRPNTFQIHKWPARIYIMVIVSMLKLVVVIDVKSFDLDLCRLILYIVLLLTDILNALIKNSPK